MQENSITENADIINKDPHEKNKTKKESYPDKEKITRIMNEYHYGDQKKAIEQMVNQLSHFVRYLMRSQYPTYSQNEDVREDLYNEAILEILKSMPKYDAEKPPTTFFAYFIVGGFRRAIEDIYDQRNTPAFKRIAKAISKCEELNKPLIETEIAAAANASITDVKKYFEYKNAHDFVYISDNPEIDTETKQKIKTPEEQMLENEKNNKIHEALKELPPHEQKIVYTFYFTKPDGDKKRHTLETVSKMTGLDKDLVQLYLQRGLKLLKKNPQLDDYHFEKFTKFSESVEFISHDISVYDSIGDENGELGDFKPVVIKTAEFVLKPIGKDDV